MTKYDVECETLIRDRLGRAVPTHRIVGEEQEAVGAGSLVWYVDPIDGTTNFAHGLPFFCTSIGLFYENEPIVGVIAAPALSVTWWGGKGMGAFRNDVRCAVTPTDELIDALGATGFAYNRWTTTDDNLAEYAAFLKRSQGIGRCGAAALDCKASAMAERSISYWEQGLSPWDVAAGVLLVREAGGTVTDYVGGSVDVLLGQVVASNGALHAPTLALLEETRTKAGLPLAGYRPERAELMKLRAVHHTASADFEAAMAIYRDAFPANERTVRDPSRGARRERFYRLHVACDDDEVVLMALVHDLAGSSFTLLEYVANVRARSRSWLRRGVLRELTSEMRARDRRVVLEVEDPAFGSNHEQRARRLRFYELLGARALVDVKYLLPPLDGTEPTEMCLMLLPADDIGAVEGSEVRSLVTRLLLGRVRTRRRRCAPRVVPRSHPERRRALGALTDTDAALRRTDSAVARSDATVEPAWEPTRGGRVGWSISAKNDSSYGRPCGHCSSAPWFSECPRSPAFERRRECQTSRKPRFPCFSARSSCFLS